MRNDHLPVQADGTIRPGGFTITDRAIRYCKFQSQARIADIGCGLGATVSYLIKEYGLSAVGLEKNAGLLDEAREMVGKRTGEGIATEELLLHGDALTMPFADNSYDGLLFECSFSKMEPSQTIMSECQRVLKPGGYWMCADLYARKEPAAARSETIGRLDTQQMIVDRANDYGFTVCFFEDHTTALQAMVGQMILDEGLESVERSMGVSHGELRAMGCGYYLMIARREV